MIYRTYIQVFPRESPAELKQLFLEAILPENVRTRQEIEQNLIFAGSLLFRNKEFLEILPVAPTFHLIFRGHQQIAKKISQDREMIAMAINSDEKAFYGAWLIFQGQSRDLNENELTHLREKVLLM